jgi:hypothetical protein
MTSQQTRDPVQDHLLTPQNAAVIIVDFQPTQVSSIQSRDRHQLVANIVRLAKNREALRHFPVLDTWDEIIRSPQLWHFNFRGPDVERLVAGRERIDLDRFYNELFSRSGFHRRADKKPLCGAICAPDAMHAAFEQFAAFTQDAVDNKVLAANAEFLRRE